MVRFGAGSVWLGLTRSVPTVDGAQYTFSLAYAGAPGLSAANTTISIYLDGQLIGTYANTSTNAALNWQALNITFQGNGKPRTLTVKLEGGADTGTAKGTMLDAISLVETLPESAATVYGFAGAPIALPGIAAQLDQTDTSGVLKTEVSGLPVGAVLSDGKKQVTVKTAGTTVDLTGWNLATLTVTLPKQWSCAADSSNAANAFTLQIKATSRDPNASTASISRSVTVQLLGGTQVATPAGVNPYVNFASSAAVTQTTLPASMLVVAAGSTSDGKGSCIISVPGALSQQVNKNASDALDFDSWFEELSETVALSLQNLLKTLDVTKH
jgi:hypothetical protein